MTRAAVIGTGAIAREHLACLSALEGVEIAGVCDLSPVMAEMTADRFGVKTWMTDHRELLEAVKPDVVHVTTPPGVHFPIAMDALRAGAHVLVEKPITTSVDDWRTLRAEAERVGRMAVENHNYRFNEPVQRIVRLQEEGLLGEVVHVEVIIALNILGPGSSMADPNSPHPASEIPGGVIGDFLPHMAYLANLFIGPHRRAETVWMKRDSAAPVSHDEFRAVVEGDRATAALVFSSHMQPDVFRLEVHGTKKRVRVNLFESTWSCERLRGGPKPLMPFFNGLSQSRSAFRGAFGSVWGKLSGRPVGYQGLWELIRRLHGAAAGQQPAPLTADDVEASARLVADLAAMEAAA
ncbi:MAG: Gfo/Idh/MocA family oxidoreductase [Planctomycetota bacterium]|nr:Gfo/Idh/MocA family oxidoreductase [Planctomycetota bacterium]